VRTDTEVGRLQTLLEGFPVILADRRDHVEAAGIANACRRHGVSVSTIDCLIAAQTTGRNAALFTLDADFERMRPHCSLRLFPVSPVVGR
jgi:predicted nucleic acid-binding protein